jgi:AcrR family transcriptional regulator
VRTVAAAAGMHLSNLQYYFPTRDALIRALLVHVQDYYMERYAERFAALPPDPMPRFVAMVDYLIEDIHSAETRRFFIQLWALLDSTDRRARMLNALYAQHLENIGRYIRDINPALPPGALQQRAAMVAAMIEGMMLMLGGAELHSRPGDEKISLAMRRQIVRIATDPA